MHSNASTSIDELAKLWGGAKHVVVFTGAGMSTESGLPDFRSAGGLWRNNRRFEELASTHALRAFPGEFDEFYRMRIRTLENVLPNPGHLALVQLEQLGHLQCLISQNVDGLHEAAGHAQVLNLHGSLLRVRCERCNTASTAETYLVCSTCNLCGGKLRPGVVLFGEALASDTLEAARSAASECELFIVLGSSLLVSPANLLPAMALKNGAKLVIINGERTPLTSKATLHLFEKIGEVLPRVVERVRGLV